MSDVFIQGDVVIVRACELADLPGGPRRRVKASEPIVLAIGEGNNAHTVIGDVVWLEQAIRDIADPYEVNPLLAQFSSRTPLFIVDGVEGAEVVHVPTTEQDDGIHHEPIKLSQGVYAAYTQKEYDYHDLAWVQAQD